MSKSKQLFAINEKTNGNRFPVFSWSQDSSYLAVGTQNRYVYILDKKGKKIVDKQIPQKGRVQMLNWDYENQLLVILIEGLSFVYLWAPLTTNLLEQLQIDNQKIRISWAKWSITHPVLTFGNQKGYINFYMKKNKRKIPTMGKHSKKIITGDWNNQGLLVTGSQDKIITFSNHTSENVYSSLAVKYEPRQLKWMNIKNDNRSKKQTTICGIMNQKTLLIYDVSKQNKAPFELMFQQKYGRIIDYQFYGDGYIIIGFSQGYYCHVSTHKLEIKDQIKSERIFNSSLESMTICSYHSKLILAGENKIKVINLIDWKQIKQQSFDLPIGCGKIAKMQFSQDGNTLIITTQLGKLFGYMLSMNIQISSYLEILALLSSPNQVNIMSCSSRKKGVIINTIELDLQPTNIILGPCHLAIKLGSLIKFYRWQKDKNIISGGQYICEINYQFNIKRIQLNQNYIAILSDVNKIHIKNIEKQISKQKIFPIQNDRQIIQYFLTKYFLIFLDTTYKLKLYHIQDKNIIIQHKSDNPILKIYPNKNGNKIILQHQNNQINLFLTSTQSYYNIKIISNRIDRILWDNQNSNQFIIITNNYAYPYVISRNNIQGNVVSPIYQILEIKNIQTQQGQPTTTKVQKNVACVSNGIVFYMSGSNVNMISLISHSYLNSYSFQQDNIQGHMRYFYLNISLRRFNNCLIAAKYIKDYKLTEILGKKALENLDLDTAIKAYQMCKNLAMVMTLEPLVHINQKNLLIGHVSMILGAYHSAQACYLKSSQPLNALDMRCDIQDWYVASELTKGIAPQQQCFISKRLATQTESQGNNTQALKQFEKSLINTTLNNIQKSKIQKHNIQCFAGIARTSMKLGDIQRGFNITKQIKQKNLLADIAVVCQNMKQYSEAAQIYQKAQLYQKAATLYLSQKMFKQVAPIMKKVKSAAVLVKFGKAKESQGAYKQAQQAYENAQAWEDVVRINLNNFDILDKPKMILRTKCSTATIAQTVAAYCSKRGIWKQAVEFLITANKKQQAFSMAQSHQVMDTYAECIGECTIEQRAQIAQYYQRKKIWDKAAQQYQLSKNALKALKLYMNAGQIFIDKMLDLLEKNTKQQHLIQQVLDYLMGQSDGQPKDPIYTYKVYRILKDFRNAAKIAVTIASQQQQAGNYTNAHQILFQSYQDIKKANVPMPMQLQKKLCILHSYILIKRVSKMGNHVQSALLINKVAKNIKQFPIHAASILTTAVMKAMRAQLKGLAYEWAIKVFHPEYKSQIPTNLVEKIKKIAMKPVNEQIPEPKSPCPFCKNLVSDYMDDCSKCLNYIPFCIISGKHVVADELSFCKHCQFAANHCSVEKMLQFQEIDKTCPMCNKSISIDDFNKVAEKGIGNLKRAPPKNEKDNQKEKQKSKKIIDN